MSVFKKIKDVLFDIEEEEEVVSKPKEVIEKNPIKEVKMPVENKSVDIDIPKKTNTFNFPMDFEDEFPTRTEQRTSEVKRYNQPVNDYYDDFAPSRRSRDEYVVKDVERKNDAPRDYSKYLQPKKEEKKKNFTPSPVISPVYGVLNQNYTKDDVIIKTDTGVKSPSLEDVRKKAYEKKKIINQEQEDEFAEPLKTLDEILINSNPTIEEAEKINDVIENTSIDNKIENIEHNNEEVANDDDTLEKDLFNLIDSMYENKENGDE